MAQKAGDKHTATSAAESDEKKDLRTFELTCNVSFHVLYLV